AHDQARAPRTLLRHSDHLQRERSARRIRLAAPGQPAGRDLLVVPGRVLHGAVGHDLGHRERRVERRPAAGRHLPLPTPRARRPEGAVMSEYAIEVEGLGVRFRRNRRAGRSIKAMFASSSRRTPKGEFWALRDINFSVKPGDSIGVVGRNGQGKSTLLKLVAGVLLPDEGSVKVHGGVAPLIEITG